MYSQPINTFSRRRNRTSMETAWEQEYPKVLNIMKQQVHDHENATELCQDLFIECFDKYNPLLNDNFTAFIFTRIKWIALRHFDTQKTANTRIVQQSLSPDAPDILETIADRSGPMDAWVCNYAVVQLLYDALPAKDHPVLDAIRYRWSSEELASAIGVSCSTARQRKTRVKAQLRSKFHAVDLLA